VRPATVGVLPLQERPEAGEESLHHWALERPTVAHGDPEGEAQATVGGAPGAGREREGCGGCRPRDGRRRGAGGGWGAGRGEGRREVHP
jgi:hypothetical protein